MNARQCGFVAAIVVAGGAGASAMFQDTQLPVLPEIRVEEGFSLDLQRLFEAYDMQLPQVGAVFVKQGDIGVPDVVMSSEGGWVSAHNEALERILRKLAPAPEAQAYFTWEAGEELNALGQIENRTAFLGVVVDRMVGE